MSAPDIEGLVRPKRRRPSAPVSGGMRTRAKLVLEVCPRNWRFGGREHVWVQACPRNWRFGGRELVWVQACPRNWRLGGRELVCEQV